MFPSKDVYALTRIEVIDAAGSLLAIVKLETVNRPTVSILSLLSIAVNPSKIRQYKGEGSGSIHWRTIIKNSRDYQQAYYHYEFWSEGDPKLRGKGGCWAIVSAVNDFSCTVKIWDSEYAVGLQHLKSYGYLPAEREQMQVICGKRSHAVRLIASIRCIRRGWRSRCRGFWRCWGS